VKTLSGANHEFVPKTYPKGKHMKILNTIWNFLLDMGQASYAAHLARNHQWQRARNIYEK